jgi:hypothetical protein
MKLKLFAVFDNCSKSIVRFAFGNNESSFCRDNVSLDIMSEKNPRGIPFKDLIYKVIGEVDTETFEVSPLPISDVDIMKSYQFKVENPVKKVSVSDN